MSRRILSGLQPTGDIHIGNYLGAIQQWVELSRQYDGFYCVVDYHAITAQHEVELLQQRSFDAALQFIAAGVDLERSEIFIQSTVPEHTELAWVFSTITPMGLLERMTQFKDKSRKNNKNINAGLFTYPVLQTADILLYKATDVPVGEDQAQHIELAREITQKFNNRYGELFPEPRTLITQARRIIGLDGKNKMSKSLNNHIAIMDTDEEIAAKLRSAVTDTRRVRLTDPGEPTDCNIFALHDFFTSPEQREEIATGCRNATIGCGECKKILADNISSFLTPLRDSISDLQQHPDTVRDVLQRGTARAGELARETMAEVRSRIGIR
ncbi:MAG: tryptophan--tRNA ligase [Candidatus Delongbacteria bacterium]|nr:tryptophan--tRNA ligase [Candidatus Delongbacteria bacterium]